MITILERITSMIKDLEAETFKNFSAATFELEKRQKPIDIMPILEREFFVIAESKKGSPSKGIIRENYDPPAIARAYEEANASAVSVITEEHFFFGSKKHLKQVRQAVNLPLLRKDFMVHPYQIYESYNLGADFVLLIAACLTDMEIEEFYHLALSLGLNVLIEVHNRQELERVLPLNPGLLGINNRNLKTFEVDINTSFDLKRYVPDDIFVISESGIASADDIKGLKEAGFAGVLIGESLLKQKNTGEALEGLLG